jgi:putative transcriptional regulator
MNQSSNLTGSVLVSFPNIRKKEFQKSVIFIFHHSNEGSMGFLVNRPLRIEEWPEPIQDMLPPLPETALWGGPSNMGRAFVLHSHEYNTEDTLAIQEDYGVSPFQEPAFTHVNAVNTIALAPLHRLILVGYIGWRPGQLEEELMNHDWLVVSACKKMLFDLGLEEKWSYAFSMLGLRQDTALTYCPGRA